MNTLQIFELGKAYGQGKILQKCDSDGLWHDLISEYIYNSLYPTATNLDSIRIKPEERILKVEELPMPCFVALFSVQGLHGMIFQIEGFDFARQVIKIPGYEELTPNKLHDLGWKYSADGQTWDNFKILS